MPYGLILELMVALILIESAPETAYLFSGTASTVTWFLLTLSGWAVFCSVNARRVAKGRRAFSQEAVEWLALIPLVFDFYFTGLNSILLELSGRFPSMGRLVALVIFLLYLAISWLTQYSTLRPAASIRPFSPLTWLMRRLTLIVPVVLPYVFVTVAGDVLDKIPVQWVRSMTSGPYGTILLLIVLLAFFFLVLPGLVKRLWRCIPLPDSPLRQAIERGLHRQGVVFSDILLWPAGEVMACTAAVIGLVPGFRYVLLTPCLIDHLSGPEIEAVITHEAEHVRRKHLVWYLFFLVSYSVVVYRLSDPILSLLMSNPYVLQLLLELDSRPAPVGALLAAVPVGLSTVFYFRFVLGFFMRNFERQADLAVFRVQGQPFALMNALRKVALLSGIDPAKPNWHHFSIAERMAFLEEAYRNPDLVRRHDTKLVLARGLFAILCVLMIAMPSFLPIETWHEKARMNAAVFVYERFVKHENKDPGWLMDAAGLFFENKMYRQAEEAYKAVLEADPDNAEAMNNLAWLYVKAEDDRFRRPKEALLLAMAAARRKQESYILDTLAECFFVNGYVERAVEIERQALRKAKANREYYEKQLQRFMKALDAGAK